MSEPLPGQVISDGMIAAWERQVRAVPGACLYRHDGLVVALTDGGGVGQRAPGPVAPVPSTTQAIVLVERQPTNPGAAVETAEALCATHGARLTVELPAGAFPALEAALDAAGLVAALRRQGMLAALPPAARDVGSVPTRTGARLRDARPDDVPTLRRLEISCFGLSPLAAERLLTEEVLADPTLRTVVAEVGGVVVAKAHGHLVRGSLGVTGVATLAPARGRGLASALVAELVTRAAGLGARRAWLVAEPDAVGVYLRLGFRSLVEWMSWLRR